MGFFTPPPHLEGLLNRLCFSCVTLFQQQAIFERGTITLKWLFKNTSLSDYHRRLNSRKIPVKGLRLGVFLLLGFFFGFFVHFAWGKQRLRNQEKCLFHDILMCQYQFGISKSPVNLRLAPANGYFVGEQFGFLFSGFLYTVLLVRSLTTYQD